MNNLIANIKNLLKKEFKTNKNIVIILDKDIMNKQRDINISELAYKIANIVIKK